MEEERARVPFGWRTKRTNKIFKSHERRLKCGSGKNSNKKTSSCLPRDFRTVVSSSRQHFPPFMISRHTADPTRLVKTLSGFAYTCEARLDASYNKCN